MPFLAGLVAIYGLLWLLSLIGVTIFDSDDLRGTIAAALMFVTSGTIHLIHPKKFVTLMPRDIWHKEIINYGIGAAEIILGIGLLFEQYRVNAAYGLVVLLIAVFPANVNMAFKKGGLYYISRIFLQPVFIWWIFWFCILRA